MDDGSLSRSIVLHPDMRGFFRERLELALGRRGVEATELTQFYLVNLLADFGYGPAERAVGVPFVELLAAAVEAPTVAERCRHYRAMGESALCAAGLFVDHLFHRGVSRDYVVDMGCRAYGAAGQLAARAPHTDVGLADAYVEVANRFDGFARAFEEVREMTALRTPQDIVKLYDRWRQTRSPLLAERLEAEGVFPQDDDEGLIH